MKYTKLSVDNRVNKNTTIILLTLWRQFPVYSRHDLLHLESPPFHSPDPRNQCENLRFHSSTP